MRLSIRKEVEINRQATQIVQFVMIGALKKLQEEENFKAMMEEMEEYAGRSGNEDNQQKEIEKSDQQNKATEKDTHQDDQRAKDLGLDTISAMLDDLERKCGQVTKTSPEEPERTDKENTEKTFPAHIQEGSMDQRCLSMDQEKSSDQRSSSTNQRTSFTDEKKSTVQKSLSTDEKESTDLGGSMDHDAKVRFEEKGAHEKAALFEDTKIKRSSQDMREDKGPLGFDCLLNTAVVTGHLLTETGDGEIKEKKTVGSSSKSRWRILSIFRRRGTKETPETDSIVELQRKGTLICDSSKEHVKGEEKKVGRSIRRRLISFCCCGKSEE